jgi:hypothetical protein
VQPRGESGFDGVGGRRRGSRPGALFRCIRAHPLPERVGFGPDGVHHGVVAELPDQRLHPGALTQLVDGGDDSVVWHCSHVRCQDTITIRISELQVCPMLTGPSMADRTEHPDLQNQERGIVAGETPRFRPGDRLWPYEQLAEEPSIEELGRLDADLQDALMENPPRRPFSYTVVFAPFETPEYAQAVELARSCSDYVETGTGARLRHRARFTLDQTEPMHRLWDLVGPYTGSDVLVDDRPVPYARELWLPLLWYLLPR